MDKQCIEVKISGKVQGVYFRAHTEDQAEKLGLKGFVKNMPDGTVLATVEGTSEQLSAFVNWCKEGSPNSNVKNVEISYVENHENFNGFEIRFEQNDRPD